MNVSPNKPYSYHHLTISNTECDPRTVNHQSSHFTGGRVRIVDKAPPVTSESGCDSRPCEVVSCYGLLPVSKRPRPGNAGSSFASPSSVLEASIFPNQNVSVLVSRRGTLCGWQDLQRWDCDSGRECLNSEKPRDTTGESIRME